MKLTATGDSERASSYCWQMMMKISMDSSTKIQPGFNRLNYLVYETYDARKRSIQSEGEVSYLQWWRSLVRCWWSISKWTEVAEIRFLGCWFCGIKSTKICEITVACSSWSKIEKMGCIKMQQMVHFWHRKCKWCGWWWRTFWFRCNWDGVGQCLC